MPPEPEFDPLRLLEALAAAEVDFVVIGGVAGGAHGSSYPTYDLDIAPAPDRANIARLRAAVRDLGSRPVRHESGSLDTHNTPFGPLDVLSMSAARYRELKVAAMRITISGRQVFVASLDHLIAMKEPLGRTKDNLMATEYRMLSDVLRAPRSGE